MGNCSLKAVTDAAAGHHCSIRVITDSGDVLHLEGPKSVQELLNDFPGYDVFDGHGLMSPPMRDDERLLEGQFYYLLPAAVSRAPDNDVRMSSCGALDQLVTRLAKGQSVMEVLPARREGVWRVKLVIDSRQLREILAEEENTEALIEQMRSAARIRSRSARERKSSWGGNLKFIISNVFKMPLENHSKVLALDSCSSSPI